MNNLPDPPVRDSTIPCKECKDGTLFWNPDESIYVCTSCGVQEKALKTWISAAEHRKRKKEQKKSRERQWALDIMGVKDKLNSPKKSKRENEWTKFIEKIKKLETD